MSSSPVEIVRELNRRFSAGDREGAAALLHPGPVIEQPRSLPHGGRDSDAIVSRTASTGSADVALVYGREALVEGRGLGYRDLRSAHPQPVYDRCRPSRVASGKVDDYGLRGGVVAVGDQSDGGSGVAHGMPSEGDGLVGPQNPVGEVFEGGPVGGSGELVVGDGASVEAGRTAPDLGVVVAGGVLGGGADVDDDRPPALEPFGELVGGDLVDLVACCCRPRVRPSG